MRYLLLLIFSFVTFSAQAQWVIDQGKAKVVRALEDATLDLRGIVLQPGTIFRVTIDNISDSDTNCSATVNFQAIEN